jgi:hypothetical protein
MVGGSPARAFPKMIARSMRAFADCGVKRKLPADTPRHEAKTHLGEWEAEIETRIATLRAKRNGLGQPLTKLNAIALAGRWYTWFVGQHQNDPGGPPKRWHEMGDHLV